MTKTEEQRDADSALLIEILTEAASGNPSKQLPDSQKSNISQHAGLLLEKLRPEDAAPVLDRAGSLRLRHLGDRGFTCAVVSAKTGACPEDCAFCAQSAHCRTGVSPHALLSREELLRQARAAAEAGAVRFSIVASGSAPTRKELEALSETIPVIRQETGLTVCASLGRLTPETAALIRDCGVNRYHHNLETARSFFPDICTTHAYDEDVTTVRTAREAGMSTCCGGIFGLGESWAQRVEFCLELRDLGPDCIPVNFLTPIPGTRLEDRPRLRPHDALLCIALARILLPDTHISVAGGREITLGSEQERIFEAGANAVMLGNYLTTKGRDPAEDIALLKAHGMSNIP